jgi:hypothetical protein
MSEKIPPPPSKCEVCGKEGEELFSTLLFMGKIPDGYVCNNCNTLFSLEGKPLATVIGI